MRPAPEGAKGPQPVRDRRGRSPPRASGVRDMAGQFANGFSGLTSGRKLLRLGAVAALSVTLSGCAAPLIGAITVGQAWSIAGLVSTVFTGRDLTEHALSEVTGKDCRILESLLNDTRDFCETPGTLATQDDFHGVIALLEDGEGTNEGEPVQLASAEDLDPQLLGFMPVNRDAAREFSLEIARDARSEDQSLSFGMLSASFGQSFAYELRYDGKRVAEATPVNEYGLRSSTR